MPLPSDYAKRRRQEREAAEQDCKAGDAIAREGQRELDEIEIERRARRVQLLKEKGERRGRAACIRRAASHRPRKET